MFSEGGAYNIGYEENVTCHGLVLNILALHLTQHMMETVRLFEVHQTYYDRIEDAVQVLLPAA